MKYIVLIGDGMGDYPRDDLGGKTVLEAADTPHMDWIANSGKGGLAQTIPHGMQPGSDVANMELMGYDTTEAFTGRAVFEALSMGRHLGKDDVAFRANLVTLENSTMRDYSAGHITTEEGRQLIRQLDEENGTEKIRFYPGVSYRHLMVWAGGTDAMKTTPPHDISDKPYEPHLPSGEGSEELIAFMKKSESVFADSIVNKKRIASGKNPATSVWFWGQGRMLTLPSIDEKFGITGGVISAVDLIKGIGVAIGMKPLFVPGATGFIDTNYKGKADTAIKALEKLDYVYVHVEAPDEAAHTGNLDMKIKAIEDFDKLVVGTVLEESERRRDLGVFVTCDHRTPIELRTHTSEPVPFAWYSPETQADDMKAFSERDAQSGSVQGLKGHDLIPAFIGDISSK